jgi:DNA-binding NarL/FixJ family response regulator
MYLPAGRQIVTLGKRGISSACGGAAMDVAAVSGGKGPQRDKMYCVLIVEDNPLFRRSLRELLEVRFPSVGIKEASDGRQALDMVRDTKPDLVFMDIKLPDKNGLELTRIIKQSHSGIPVIILTSYDFPEYREAAMHSGASYFLTKGNAKSDEIAAAVSSALRFRDESNGNGHSGDGRARM